MYYIHPCWVINQWVNIFRHKVHNRNIPEYSLGICTNTLWISPKQTIFILFKISIFFYVGDFHKEDSPLRSGPVRTTSTCPISRCCFYGSRRMSCFYVTSIQSHSCNLNKTCCRGCIYQMSNAYVLFQGVHFKWN